MVGISSDTENSHRKFTSRYQLPFILLSDPEKKVRRKFRVENRMLSLLPGRQTFVIDKKGKVAMVFEAMRASGHVPNALRALKKL